MLNNKTQSSSSPIGGGGNAGGSGGISDMEMAAMRQNLSLLQNQIRVGRLDPEFLGRQIDKLTTFFERMEVERQKARKYGQFEALFNLSRALGSSLDLQTVLNQVMDAIIQLTGAERGFLMLQDDDGALSVQAARNFDQQTLGSDDFKYSRTVANQVLDSGKPILTTNAAEDPRFSGQASIVAQSLRSVMATPLLTRGRVIGVVYVDSKALAGLFREDDLTALDALSGQAAVAIENARLFDATDKQLALRVEELRQLRRIDLLLNETLDADKAMAFTLEWACRLANASSGHLGLVDQQAHTLPTLHHYGESIHQHAEHLEAAYPRVWDVVTHNKTVSFNPTEAEVDSEATRGTLPQQVLIVPIQRENAVIGVVILERQDAQPFTAEQQDIVERVVARAAITIENARLYDAVRAADKAKSEFVGIVAHDLKAPMNGIGGYADLMLMQGGVNERQTDYLTKIKDTVRRMAILVSDLADISRIESGHFFMDELPVPVQSIVQAVQDGTMPQIQERHHTFVVDVEPDLPDMYVDYYRLLQVLTNLVSNAYKYTPDNGSITLRARRKEDRILFQISDTGIGLTEEGIAKLREGAKFWRAEDRFTRSQQGTGLGFAITRSLIEQMGSQIDIQSEVGKGSTFSFDVKMVSPDITIVTSKVG